jgi:isoaspartyl peptidase/L-asparaginase-like protein (Ntn-hydrolase superfamily)
MHRPVAIAVHGGAGNLARYKGTGRLEEAHAFLEQHITLWHTMLCDGVSALDVACESVRALEDIGYFHAGKGSSPNDNGYVELDASIMRGSDRAAGAIAAVRTPKNPIDVARYIMEQTQQVLMVASEADTLITREGFATVDASYFVPCDEVGAALPSTGTVGAVVLDRDGEIVAATSTGGTLRKRAGRVGDAPIIGAVGAVSCTGVGEYFLRTSAASRILARVELLGEHISTATGSILTEIVHLGGDGGMIALDHRGTIAMPFSTSGMYRAAVDATGIVTVGCL